MIWFIVTVAIGSVIALWPTDRPVKRSSQFYVKPYGLSRHELNRMIKGVDRWEKRSNRHLFR